MQNRLDSLLDAIAGNRCVVVLGLLLGFGSALASLSAVGFGWFFWLVVSLEAIVVSAIVVREQYNRAVARRCNEGAISERAAIRSEVLDEIIGRLDGLRKSAELAARIGDGERPIVAAFIGAEKFLGVAIRLPKGIDSIEVGTLLVVYQLTESPTGEPIEHKLFLVEVTLVQADAVICQARIILPYDEKVVSYLRRQLRTKLTVDPPRTRVEPLRGNTQYDPSAPLEIQATMRLLTELRHVFASNYSENHPEPEGGDDATG